MSRSTVIKFAALLGGAELQPQQERIADTGDDAESRMLVYHTLGSGKTFASLAAGEHAGDPMLAITPAAVRPQFKAEYENFTDGQTPLAVESYNRLAKGDLKPAPTMIIDEAHRLRNPGTKQTAAAEAAAAQAKHLYLLTGSPIVNQPEDLAPLASMLTQKRITPQQFASRFIGSKRVNPGWSGWWHGAKPVDVPTIKNQAGFADMLRGHVDYHAPQDPNVEINSENVETEMSRPQEQLYRAFWDQLPTLMRWKLQRNYPMSRTELTKLTSFLAGPRQVGLSTLPFQRGNADPLRAFNESPKLQEAFQRLQTSLKDPAAKAVVASNFVRAGLEPYAAKLQAEKIPYTLFDGRLSDVERKQVVNDYNTGNQRVMLLGPPGSEGLSLKGTRLMQLLDPHWNAARGNQTVGRGARYNSHLHLPEADRNMQVQRFYSRLPSGWKSWFMKQLYSNPNKWSEESVDHYLDNMTQRKQHLNDEFLQALQAIGSEKQADHSHAATEFAVRLV